MLIKILIFLLFVTFPLGQVLRWEFLGGQLVVRPNDLIALVLGSIGIFKVSGPLKKPLLIWFGAMVISLVVNVLNYAPSQILISATYIVRFILYSGLYFIFKDIKLNKNVFVYATLAVALAGFGQYLFIPDVSFLAQFNWDPHYYRLISTFLDPGFTGAILVLGLLLTRNKFYWAVIYVALALTYSRTSFLMFMASYTCVAIYKKSPKIFIGALVLMIATLIFLPRTFGDGTKLTRETSTLARLKNWQESVEVWTTAPVFGVGYNTYRYVTNSAIESHAGAGADASLLLVMATTGLFGLFSFFNLLKSIFIQGRGNVLFTASLTGVIIASFFNNTLLYPFVMEWMWILLGTSQKN